MNKKPMTLTTIAAAFAALTLMSACDKRDNTATPPMPQTSPGTPSNSTTPGGGTTGSTGTMGGTGSTGGAMPGDASASAPGAGASR